MVATAPTVYGIETYFVTCSILDSFYKLQQHLPFTVLKPSDGALSSRPFACCNSTYRLRY